MNSTKDTAIDLAGDDSDTSSVQIIEKPWAEAVEETAEYKVLFELFQGRKHGSPASERQHDLLTSFMNQPGGDHFTGRRKRLFDEISKSLKDTHSTNKSTLKKRWPLTYTSAKLALIVLLIQEEKADKTSQPSRTSARASSSTGGTKSTALNKAVTKLLQVYTPVRRKFDEAALADQNKTSRTPSLDYQKSGTRVQDGFQFDKSKALQPECPVCHHRNTMSVSNNEEVNAENERRRQAAGVDGKFTALSSKSACFCHQLVGLNVNSDGDDNKPCPCQVTFDEDKRHTIALAITRNEERSMRKSKAAKPPPEGTTSRLYYNHVRNSLQSEAVREQQNSDGRSEVEMIQNAGTQASLSIIGDEHIVSDSTLRRELQSQIPRTTTVQWRGQGTAAATPSTLTLAQARRQIIDKRKAQKISGLSTYGGPSQVPFITNKTPTNTATAAAVSASAAAASAPKEELNDPSRKRRNNLSPVPLSFGGPVPPNANGNGSSELGAAGAGLAPSNANGCSERVTRVRKKCTSMLLDERNALTPETAKKVRTIHKRTRKRSPGIMETIDDDLPFTNSQEAVGHLLKMAREDD